MRDYRIIFLLFLITCKVKQPSNTSVYYEDLSIYRPLADTLPHNSQTIPPTNINDQAILTGHIKSELDSIIQISKRINKEGRFVNGYIIQVYSGSSREMAYQTISEIRESFPNLKPKMSYYQPTFRVRVGRFTEKLQANRIHQQVKKEFRQAILLPKRFFLNYE